MSDPYWMIEKGPPAQWWVSGGRGIGGDYIENWTIDASKAQHFNEASARRHAEELQSWGVKGPLFVTEHLDIEFWKDRALQAESALTAARAAERKVRDALRMYGRHFISCNVLHHSKPCSCGLDSALAAPDNAAPSEKT